MIMFVELCDERRPERRKDEPVIARSYEDIFPLRIKEEKRSFMWAFKKRVYRVESNKSEYEEMANISHYLNISKNELKEVMERYNCRGGIFEKRRDVERFIEDYVEPRIVMRILSGEVN